MDEIKAFVKDRDETFIAAVMQVLFFEGLGKSALAVIENEAEMNEIPENVRKACRIIAEELDG